MNVKTAALGIDTVRVKYTFNEPLPTRDKEFLKSMMEMGWEPKTRTHLMDNEEDSPTQSHVYFLQPNEQSLRFSLINSGRDVFAEFSVPRTRDNSILNFNLASPSEAKEALHETAEDLKTRLPVKCNPKIERLTRIDTAIDVYAEEAKKGLISATRHFKILNAKKANVITHNHETTTIKTTSAIFRAYDKGSEALAKTKKMTLTHKEQKQISDAVKFGRVRMEFVFKNKTGFTVSSLDTILSKYADVLERGFGGGLLKVGNLEVIRQRLDELEINEMARSKLYMFVVRYLYLGLEGTRERMSKTSYYEAQKLLRANGISISDIEGYEGTIDLRPIIEDLRMAA